MGNNNLNTIDKIYILKANTLVFSIALQENIRFNNDVYLKVTNTLYNDDDSVFGILQGRISNLNLSFMLGKDMSSFYDKTHGDVATKLSDLTPYEFQTN